MKLFQNVIIFHCLHILKESTDGKQIHRQSIYDIVTSIHVLKIIFCLLGKQFDRIHCFHLGSTLIRFFFTWEAV